MNKASLIVMTLVMSTLLMSCSRNSKDQLPNNKNLVELNTGSDQRKEIGDSTMSFSVMNTETHEALMGSGKLEPTTSSAAQTLLNAIKSLILGTEEQDKREDSNTPAQKEEQLLVGLPLSLLNENYVFGGVITKVSDQVNESLGMLKLSDLTPIHVRPVVAKAKEGYALVLLGCLKKCTESSKQEVIATFPVTSVDVNKNRVVVNLSAVAKNLNLVKLLGFDGVQTMLKTKSVQTVSVDYSLSTLVFDIVTTMIPMTKEEMEAATFIQRLLGFPTPNFEEELKKLSETQITSRWYLKLASTFNAAFVPRGATEGVGYFMTERAAESRIQRFSTTSAEGESPVRYFIKNVPAEYQAGFKAGFDEWNAQYKKVIGKNLIDYVFVEPGSELDKYLVTGDIRFNILEWDVTNKAPYGGLGPSMANQFTGQMLSANTLVQGPTIVTLYKEWFANSKKADDLEKGGDVDGAEALRAQFARDHEAKIAAMKPKARYELVLGQQKFSVYSQMPQYEDPVKKLDFDEVPEGYTYEQYMHGYFLDLVAHELGHNLGLRHNFKGNMGADDKGTPRVVSRSIMEYLGRAYRYLDHVGEYDVMAIGYGYKGLEPKNKNWFCTDENATDFNAKASAECSRNDATEDPYAYFEGRVTKALNFLLNGTSTSAPVWGVKDMASSLQYALGGLAFYAHSAVETSATWTNFHKSPDRPRNGAAIAEFVKERMVAQVCDASLDARAAGKDTDAGRAAAFANLKELRELTKETFNTLSVKLEMCATKEMKDLGPITDNIDDLM